MIPEQPRLSSPPSSGSLEHKDGHSQFGAATIRRGSIDAHAHPTHLDHHDQPLSPFTWRQYFNSLKSRDGWLGDYDYTALLIPDLPFLKRKHRPARFFEVNEPSPVFLAILFGLQHALAMVGGIITPPLLSAGSAGLALDASAQQSLLSASLIWSGIATVVQVSRIGPYRGYFCETVGPAPFVIPGSFD
jgi:hypothetical protein